MPFRSPWYTKQVTPVVPESWLIELAGNTASGVDERTTSIALIKEYQRLYEVDSLTFGLVNFLVEKIVPGIVFIGNEQVVQQLNKWAELISLKIKIEDIIRDCIVAGGSWIEPVYSSISIEDIKDINPSTMDFERDTNDNVKIDEEGDPVGYVQEVNAVKIYWHKDSITSNNREIYHAKKNEDIRDRVKYITILRWGDSALGIPLLRPVYRSAIIRSNLEDMVGESAFRGGGIVAYVSGEPPKDTKDNLKRDLTNITSKNIFLLTDKIKLSTIPIPDLTQRENLIYQLADFEAAGLGVPLDVMLTGGRQYRGDLIPKMADMEVRISSYQERLALQINKEIIFPLLKKWNVKEIAVLKFISSSPATQLQRARVIATLARRELMTYDPELEIQLRKELSLPYSEVNKELENWKANGRPKVIENKPDINVVN